jgi:hypothetical protein
MVSVGVLIHLEQKCNVTWEATVKKQSENSDPDTEEDLGYKANKSQSLLICHDRDYLVVFYYSDNRRIYLYFHIDPVVGVTL